MRRFFLTSAIVCLLASLPIKDVRADNIEELVDLLLIKEDLKNQHTECIESSKRRVEGHIEYSINKEYEGIHLDSEDLAILITIYSEYYNYGCEYLAGEEIINFYRSHIRKRFTPDEIEDLIQFYKTPLGLKLNQQFFEISTEFGQIQIDRGQVDTQQAQENFDEQIIKFQEYLEKKIGEKSSGGQT